MLCEHYGNGRHASRVHMYQGSRRPLDGEEKTSFAAKHGIRYKPEVTKIGIMNRVQRLRHGDNDVPAHVQALEKACERVDTEEGEACNAPCTLHQNGSCYYADEA